MLSVSIAICTWNRSELLAKTLEQMCALKTPEGVDWELLVVNNNCSDDTEKVVSRLIHALPIRLLHEQRQGLSHARNCAVAAARGELLIWTDDDVLVDPDWINAYVRASREYPDVAFFGGPIDPWFAATPPDWVLHHLDLLEGMLVIRKPMGEGSPVLRGRLPFGANMAIRTALLKQYPFDPKLGRCGVKLTSGDETDVLSKMIAAGHRGCWIADAKLRHYVDLDRCTVRYLKRFNEGMGYTRAVVNVATTAPKWFGIPRYVVRSLAENTVKAWATAPLRNRTWIRSVKEAARARGAIRYAVESRGG